MTTDVLRLAFESHDGIQGSEPMWDVDVAIVEIDGTQRERLVQFSRSTTPALPKTQIFRAHLSRNVKLDNIKILIGVESYRRVGVQVGLQGSNSPPQMIVLTPWHQPYILPELSSAGAQPTQNPKDYVELKIKRESFNYKGQMITLHLDILYATVGAEEKGFQMNIGLNNTIYDFKTLIHEKKGIHKDQIVIRHPGAGVALTKDNETFRNYRITHGTTLIIEEDSTRPISLMNQLSNRPGYGGPDPPHIAKPFEADGFYEAALLRIELEPDKNLPGWFIELLNEINLLSRDIDAYDGNPWEREALRKRLDELIKKVEAMRGDPQKEQDLVESALVILKDLQKELERKISEWKDPEWFTNLMQRIKNLEDEIKAFDGAPGKVRDDLWRKLNDLIREVEAMRADPQKEPELVKIALDRLRELEKLLQSIIDEWEQKNPEWFRELMQDMDAIEERIKQFNGREGEERENLRNDLNKLGKRVKKYSQNPEVYDPGLVKIASDRLKRLLALFRRKIQEWEKVREGLNELHQKAPRYQGLVAYFLESHYNHRTCSHFTRLRTKLKKRFEELKAMYRLVKRPPGGIPDDVLERRFLELFKLFLDWRYLIVEHFILILGRQIKQWNGDKEGRTSRLYIDMKHGLLLCDEELEDLDPKKLNWDRTGAEPVLPIPQYLGQEIKRLTKAVQDAKKLLRAKADGNVNGIWDEEDFGLNNIFGNK